MRFFIDTLSLRKRQQVIQCNVSQSDVCEIIAWYSYCSQFYEYYDIFHPEEIED